MSKRIMVTMLALALSLFAVVTNAADAQKKSTKKASAAAEKAEEKAPRLTIVEPVKDYGTVAKGEKLTWAFTVKNTGNADLQIISAKPGCGCTVTEFDKVIKPGESGKVVAHVDTTNFTGPIAKPVTLETNDPSTPTAQLTINATVQPYVEAFPAGFVRFTLLQGEADTQSVTLFSEEQEPFEITKVESPSEWVKVDYKKIDDPSQLAPNGRAGQNQYKFNITVGGPDAKVGPIAEKVHIATNSKHQPDFFVSVTGVIRPTLRVEPPVLNFGEVSPADAAATRSLVVRSNNLKTPEVLSVTKVETTLPGVTASVKPTANKGEFEVLVQVAKDAKAGELDGQVKIYTNDTVNPIVNIPLRGTVKAAVVSAASKASK